MSPKVTVTIKLSHWNPNKSMVGVKPCSHKKKKCSGNSSNLYHFNSNSKSCLGPHKRWQAIWAGPATLLLPLWPPAQEVLLVHLQMQWKDLAWASCETSKRPRRVWGTVGGQLSSCSSSLSLLLKKSSLFLLSRPHNPSLSVCCKLKSILTKDAFNSILLRQLLYT